MASPFAHSSDRVDWREVGVLACGVAVVGFLAWRSFATLNYSWDWSSVLQFLVRRDPATGSLEPGLLLYGLATTIRITLWSGLIAAVVGCVMGACRVSKVPYFRWISRTYVDTIRSVPPLVFIFVVYFFLASQMQGALASIGIGPDAVSPLHWQIIDIALGPSERMPAFVSAMLTLGIFEGAYITEIVRGGIQSISHGQWEAGTALGLSRGKTFRLIVLPQALRKTIPPLAGQFISLIKDSSIVSLISIQDLTFLAVDVSVSTRRVFETWILVSGIYLCMCLLLSRAAAALERNLS